MAFCSLPPGILRRVTDLVLVTHTHRRGKWPGLKVQKEGLMGGNENRLWNHYTEAVSRPKT